MLSTKTAKLITLLFILIFGIGCSQSSDIPTAQPVDLTPVLYQQITPTQSGNSTQIPPSAAETPVATTIPVPSPTDSPAPSAAVTRKTAGPPVKGGTLLLSGDSAPILDPHQISDPASADIVVEIFGGLVTYEIQDPSSWRHHLRKPTVRRKLLMGLQKQSAHHRHRKWSSNCSALYILWLPNIAASPN